MSVLAWIQARIQAWVLAWILPAAAMAVVFPASAAHASPSPAAAPVAQPAVTACVATDHRLIGLSGLIVTPSGFVAISDSNIDKRAIRVWLLDKKCHYVRSISYPTDAFDPEDAAIGRDGTIYVADIGDNSRQRASIALWRIPVGSNRPHLYRYRYPDGAHDAEAMVLAADDTPIFITKDPGAGNIFVPTKPADPSGKPVPLRKVGVVYPTATGTPNPFGIVGSLVFTGGANSPDRTKVALRTYADAYEWDVPDGDVIRAMTTTKPRITALPDEPQGESIAYGQDGTHFFTVSDAETVPVRTPILEYGTSIPARPAAKPPLSASVRPPQSATNIEARRGISHRWTYPMVAIGLVVLLTATGLSIRRRSRRTRRRV